MLLETYFCVRSPQYIIFRSIGKCNSCLVFSSKGFPTYKPWKENIGKMAEARHITPASPDLRSLKLSQNLLLKGPPLTHSPHDLKWPRRPSGSPQERKGSRKHSFSTVAQNKTKQVISQGVSWNLASSTLGPFRYKPFIFSDVRERLPMHLPSCGGEVQAF